MGTHGFYHKVARIIKVSPNGSAQTLPPWPKFFRMPFSKHPWKKHQQSSSFWSNLQLFVGTKGTVTHQWPCKIMRPWRSLRGSPYGNLHVGIARGRYLWASNWKKLGDCPMCSMSRFSKKQIGPSILILILQPWTETYWDPFFWGDPMGSPVAKSCGICEWRPRPSTRQKIDWSSYVQIIFWDISSEYVEGQGTPWTAMGLTKWN